MSKIVKVDTKNKFRTLLTDVLPYELPLWFSNFNFYQIINSHSNNNETILKTYKQISGLPDTQNNYIPLNYQVSRGGNKTLRLLSIMHPLAQLKVCDFYYDYDDLIEYYCTRSKHSLRHPYRKTTAFYGKLSKGSKLVGGVEGEDEDRIVASSYFKYKKYPFLYKFFESYEYHRLEKQFHSMVQVDIAKCFPSIYTHTIGWAVKGKRLAKSSKSCSGRFDNEFDDLMQSINYRETNGIIVGPEVSRIFAEIILQKVELNLIEQMENKKYQISKDYDFRRYVDDFFIFYRSEEVRDYFLKSLELCLLEYKMHLNEAKTSIVTRPFSTDISLAKYALKSAIDKCYSYRYDKINEGIVYLNSPATKANKMIAEIKMALANYRVEYSSISNYLFSAITRKINIYIKKTSDILDKENYHLNWLLVDLDLIFFVHAMDIRIRPTDWLARLIHDLLGNICNWRKTFRNMVYKKIFDNVRDAINIFINHSNEILGLETLNLLIILTMLPDEYQLPVQRVEKYLDILNEDSSPYRNFYFYWVTFMLYIGDKPQYKKIKEDLINYAQEYIKSHQDKFSDSEYFMFYFDYLACPYIDKDIRKVTFENFNNLSSSKTNALQRCWKTVLDNDFIVTWRDKNYLQNSLLKKEYLYSYGS